MQRDLVTSRTNLSERELFGLVYRRMRALAGGKVSDLDDLVQRAMEQVLKSLTRFDGRSELSTWIYGVCYRVLLHERRWHRRFRARFSLGWEEEVGTPSETPSPAVALEAKTRVAALNRALARMSEKYRVVVVLHDLEQLEISKVVEIVQVGELTVRSRLRDGRKQLGRLLRQDPEYSTRGADR